MGTTSRRSEPETGLALHDQDALAALRRVTTTLEPETEAAIQSSMDDVSPIIPFARIRQRGSGDSGEVLGGLRFNDGRPDMALPAELLIIAVKRARIRWPDKYAEGDLALCKSDDGIYSREDVPQRFAVVCAECSESRWPTTEEREAGCRRPRCGEGLNLLVTTPDLGDAFVVNFHGKGLRPVQAYLGRLKRKKLGFFYTTTALHSSHERGPFGAYYVPVFDEGQIVSTAFYQALAAQIQDYLAAMSSGVKAASEEAIYGAPEENGGSGDPFGE